MWLFRCPVATNVTSKVILLDTAALDQIFLSNLLLFYQYDFMLKPNKKLEILAMYNECCFYDNIAQIFFI